MLKSIKIGLRPDISSLRFGTGLNQVKMTFYGEYEADTHLKILQGIQFFLMFP